VTDATGCVVRFLAARQALAEAFRSSARSVSLPTCAFFVDAALATVKTLAMRKLLQIFRELPWARLSGVAVALVVLQLLTVVFPLQGVAAVSGAKVDASVTMAGKLCRIDTGDDNAPAQSGPHHHCTLCSNGNYDEAVAVADLAKVIFVFVPRSDEAPRWFVHDDPSPSPPGWTSSWSSRAPPVLS